MNCRAGTHLGARTVDPCSSRSAFVSDGWAFAGWTNHGLSGMREPHAKRVPLVSSPGFGADS